ncbi:hypothetical protein [Zhongshania borealis]|uniref:Phage abortive infection protein n=1 Tax=Zhongshania borealis TaxID=889488 RepID=A0ABP7WZA8_9GAMM
MKVDHKSHKSLLILISFLALLITLAVIFVYFSIFNDGLSNHQDVWGSFGDYIGGTLNPALSFLSLLALLYTIHLQSRELSMTRLEMERSADAQVDSSKALQRQLKAISIQNFNSIFYPMLKIYVSSIKTLISIRPNRTSPQYILDELHIKAVDSSSEEPKVTSKTLQNDSDFHVFATIFFQILSIAKANHTNQENNPFTEQVTSLLNKKLSELLTIYLADDDIYEILDKRALFIENKCDQKIRDSSGVAGEKLNNLITEYKMLDHV